MRMQVVETVNLKKLKNFVAKALPNDSFLRILILNENDHLSPMDFCFAVKIYLELLQIERKNNR